MKRGLVLLLGLMLAGCTPYIRHFEDGKVYRARILKEYREGSYLVDKFVFVGKDPSWTGESDGETTNIEDRFGFALGSDRDFTILEKVNERGEYLARLRDEIDLEHWDSYWESHHGDPALFRYQDSCLEDDETMKALYFQFFSNVQNTLAGKTVDEIVEGELKTTLAHERRHRFHGDNEEGAVWHAFVETRLPNAMLFSEEMQIADAHGRVSAGYDNAIRTLQWALDGSVGNVIEGKHDSYALVDLARVMDDAWEQVLGVEVMSK
jgi:hypothetical protein